MLSHMLDSIFRRKKPTSLSYDEVQIVQLIVQQTVLYVGGLESMPLDSRTRLTCAMAEEVLEDMGVFAPPALVETLVEAAFRLSRDLLTKSPPGDGNGSTGEKDNNFAA